MRAIIQGNTIILPKEIIKKAHLPKNGECEVIADEKEIRITRPAPKPKYLLNLLRKPAKKIPIEKMIEMEVVEDG